MVKKLVIFYFFLHSFLFSSSVVHLYVFYSSDCEKCEIVSRKNLQDIEKRVKTKIEAGYFNIEDIANYQKLCELENKYKDTDNELPVVFIGRYVLGGEAEIKDKLEKAVREYSKEGTDWPDEIKEENNTKTIENKVQLSNPTYLGFFYQTTCKKCERVFWLLNYLKETHPNLIIKEFNLDKRENKILFEAIADKINIPENKRLIPATLIIGNNYLQQKQINLENTQVLLAKYEKTGSVCIWDITEEERQKAEKKLERRFSSLRVPLVCFAGLIDGINPCAFAVLVFFISYLSVIKRRKREILIVGLSFMFAVFLIYFLIGSGIFSFLSQFTSYTTFSKVLNVIVGVGAIILGIYSFSDFLKAKRGQITQMKLQLPKTIKTKIHSTIIKKMSLSNYIIGAFFSGVIVSFLEFGCTGQVYLPTIIFVLNEPTFTKQGYFYLILYNLFFILPLFLILILFYIGTTSKKLANFSSKNIPAVKLILSLFFFILGISLLSFTF